MHRDRTSFLINWLNSNNRKPLIVRGARQVGKTWIIRDLAKSQGRELIELNFEKRPDMQSLFSSNDPKEIITNVEAAIGKKVDIVRTILFLDEIQAVPCLLGKLRWFSEEMSDLPVVVAGSLLDFTLSKHEFSMPVGRISYFHLEPLSFEEFLDASGENELRSYLQNYDWNQTIPDTIHLKLIKFVKEYLIVGGMPASVSAWVNEKDPNSVNQIHFDLLATYRDDFAKYRGRLSIDHLENIMDSVPCQLGKKFVYKNANSESGTAPLKHACQLLFNARICHPVVSTAANGLPLGAETNEKFFKVIMLDCGLCCTLLGLSLHQLRTISEISMINNGGMAEQLVGQLLRAVMPAYIPPSLYYWQREKKGSEAEVDYIIQHENQVVPIEVKAGITGKLKSLHQFMNEKKKMVGVRVNSDLPKLGRVSVKDHLGQLITYNLMSIPFYLLEQLHRLITSAEKKS